MAKIFSSIPPFLCKSSRVRQWVPVFDGHFGHGQVSDLNHICFLARLHEVHRAIAVTPVVHVPVPVCVPVPVRVTLALKFSRSPYLDNHLSESIHTWTIDTL